VTGKLRRATLAAMYKPQFDELYVALARRSEAAASPVFQTQLSIGSANFVDCCVQRLDDLQIAADAKRQVETTAAPLLRQVHFSGDFLDFEFVVPPETPMDVAAALFSALAESKRCCRVVRDNLATWKKEKADWDLAALEKVDAAVAAGSGPVIAAAQAIDVGTLSLESLWDAVFRQQVAVRKEHAAYKQVCVCVVNVVASFAQLFKKMYCNSWWVKSILGWRLHKLSFTLHRVSISRQLVMPHG
jgi:hypothetical protein